MDTMNVTTPESCLLQPPLSALTGKPSWQPPRSTAAKYELHIRLPAQHVQIAWVRLDDDAALAGFLLQDPSFRKALEGARKILAQIKRKQ